MILFKKTKKYWAVLDWYGSKTAIETMIATDNQKVFKVKAIFDTQSEASKWAREKFMGEQPEIKQITVVF
jgi:hypothetical protein